MNNKTGLFAQPQYLSPRYYKSGKTCKFRFYYHMNGSSYAQLSVNIRRNNIDTYLWSDNFLLSDEWRNATVELPACLTDFQVCRMAVVVNIGLTIVVIFIATIVLVMIVMVAVKLMKNSNDSDGVVDGGNSS